MVSPRCIPPMGHTRLTLYSYTVWEVAHARHGRMTHVTTAHFGPGNGYLTKKASRMQEFIPSDIMQIFMENPPSMPSLTLQENWCRSSGYHARILERHDVPVNVHSMSWTFLTEIQMPIIFAGHSMGGLVSKKVSISFKVRNKLYAYWYKLL